MCRDPPDGAAVVTVVSLDPPAAVVNGVPAHHPQKEAVPGSGGWRDVGSFRLSERAGGQAGPGGGRETVGIRSRRELPAALAAG